MLRILCLKKLFKNTTINRPNGICPWRIINAITFETKYLFKFLFRRLNFFVPGGLHLWGLFLPVRTGTGGRRTLQLLAQYWATNVIALESSQMKFTLLHQVLIQPFVAVHPNAENVRSFQTSGILHPEIIQLLFLPGPENIPCHFYPNQLPMVW